MSPSNKACKRVSGGRVLGVGCRVSGRAGVPQKRRVLLSSVFCLLPFCVLPFLLLLVGCGGGGNSGKGTGSGKTPTGKGRTTITILWPKTTSKATRVIPASTQSIEITINDPGYNNLQVGHNVMNAPIAVDANGNRTSSHTFDDLPYDTLNLTAKAWSEINAGGEIVASASANLKIPDDTAPTISLISAVDSVAITSPTGFTTTNPRNTVSLTPNQTLQLGVTARSAPTMDLPQGYIVPVAQADLHWQSGDSANTIIKVDQNTGLVTAVGLGKTTVTVTEASSMKTSSPIDVEVKTGGVQNIVIEQPSPQILPVDQSLTLKADVTDNNNNLITLTGLQWNTVPANTGKDVIQLNPNTGVVTGLKLGTVLVNVTDPVSNRSSQPIQINVSAGSLDHISITPASINPLHNGDQVTLTAMAQDKSGNQIVISPGNLVWTIDNTAVASVSNNGVSTDTTGASVTGTSVTVTGKTRALKPATITVMETGSGKTMTISVSVNIAVSIAPIGPVIVNGTVKCVATVTGAASNAKVNWSVVNMPADGTIDMDGTYHAPNKTGTFMVQATSQEDKNQTATQAVTVSLGSGIIQVQ